MELTSILIFAGALAVAAGSPGPSIAALVARVLARGHRDVWPFLAAMWIGEAAWLSCAVWGLSALAGRFATGFLVVKWLGIVYLGWLAWKMWRAPPAAEGALPERGSRAGMFWAGLAVTLGNPKIMVFYLALLPAILDLTTVGVAGWAELVLAMLVVLAAVDVAWVAAAARARLLLHSPAAIRVANRLSAGLLAGAAAAMAARA